VWCDLLVTEEQELIFFAGSLTKGDYYRSYREYTVKTRISTGSNFVI